MRKKIHTILTIIGVLLLVSGSAFFLIGYFKPKPAGILVESIPDGSVFINGQEVGKTSYEGTFPPGEIVVKITPNSLTPLAPYETKITLVSGIRTIVRREFGEAEESAQGEIISFEKIGGSTASLAVVSIPNSAQITIDGQVRGFAPVKISSITPGEHQVVVSAQGYKERVLSPRTLEGYKLTAVVKLALNAEVPTTAPVEEVKPQVEILTTPVGFLRVRKEANSASLELAQVKPGEKYPLLEEDTTGKWMKIEYEAEKTGWISAQYAKKIEVTPTITGTPTPSVTPAKVN